MKNKKICVSALFLLASAGIFVPAQGQGQAVEPKKTSLSEKIIGAAKSTWAGAWRGAAVVAVSRFLRPKIIKGSAPLSWNQDAAFWRKPLLKTLSLTSGGVKFWLYSAYAKKQAKNKAHSPFFYGVGTILGWLGTNMIESYFNL